MTARQQQQLHLAPKGGGGFNPSQAERKRLHFNSWLDHTPQGLGSRVWEGNPRMPSSVRGQRQLERKAVGKGSRQREVPSTPLDSLGSPCHISAAQGGKGYAGLA